MCREGARRRGADSVRAALKIGPSRSAATDRLMVLALEHNGPAIYNVVDDHPAAVREWVAVLAEVLAAPLAMCPAGSPAASRAKQPS